MKSYFIVNRIISVCRGCKMIFATISDEFATVYIDGTVYRVEADFTVYERSDGLFLQSDKAKILESRLKR